MPKTQYNLPEGFHWLTPEEVGLGNPEEQEWQQYREQQAPPTLYNPKTGTSQEVTPAFARSIGIPIGPPRASGEVRGDTGFTEVPSPTEGMGSNWDVPLASAFTQYARELENANKDKSLKELAREVKKSFEAQLQRDAEARYPAAEAAALPPGSRPTLYNPATKKFEEVSPAMAAEHAIPLGPPRATGEHAPEGGVIFSSEPWKDRGAQLTPETRGKMLAQVDTSDGGVSTDRPTGGTQGLPPDFSG